MYLRQDCHGNDVFVPEDGRERRSAPMTANVRVVDPPTRPRWQGMLKPFEKSNRLLRDYIAERIERTNDRGEAFALRKFLAAVNRVCVDGNDMGLYLAVCKSSTPQGAVVYVSMKGRRIVWLPSVETHMSDKLGHIVREGGMDRVAIAMPAKQSKRQDDDSVGRRGMTPKVKTTFNPGSV